MKFTHADNDDLDQIAELENEAFPLLFDAHTEKLLFQMLPYTFVARDRTTKVIGLVTAYTLDGTLPSFLEHNYGCMLGEKTKSKGVMGPHVLYVSNFCVTKRYQRKGVGHMLIRYLVRTLNDAVQMPIQIVRFSADSTDPVPSPLHKILDSMQYSSIGAEDEYDFVDDDYDDNKESVKGTKSKRFVFEKDEIKEGVSSSTSSLNEEQNKDQNKDESDLDVLEV